MEKKSLSPQTKRNLELLAQLPLIKQFYLAGGTACALYYNHRISYDLDFFSGKKFEVRRLEEQLRKLGKLEIDTIEENTFLGYLNGVKISFFYYQYPLIKRSKEIERISVASKQDLSAMKIDALQSRGTKRDFIDLYTLLNQENWGIDLAISNFKEKYRQADYNIEHVVMSLTYFQDAEEDGTEPEMLADWDWGKIKEFFISQIKKYEKKKIGI